MSSQRNEVQEVPEYETPLRAERKRVETGTGEGRKGNVAKI